MRALLAIACVLAGCAEDTDSRNGSGAGSQNGMGGGAGTSNSDGFASPGGEANAGGMLNPAAGGDTEVDRSLIWIANSEEGTVSKIDTRTLEELGRYITSPNGDGLPSRTSVALDGDMVVANRGTSNRHPGVFGDTGVTKIYASLDSCPDANGNGTVDTSTGATNVLPWGEDECIAWHTPLPHESNRPVQWGVPGLDADVAPVWTAATSACSPDFCTFDIFILNGSTGAIDRTIPATSPPGTPNAPDNYIPNFGPYGATVDAGGNAWFLIANTTYLFRVDALTYELQQWPIPMANGYGITVDSTGRIHLCGEQGLSRFDPSSATWESLQLGWGGGGATTVPGGQPGGTWEEPVSLGHNGCMTDGNGTLWAAAGADQGTAGLHAFSTDTLAAIESFPVGNVKGVSIDIDGFVWGVGSAGNGMFAQEDDWGRHAYKLDTVTGNVETFSGLNGAYSYSDMTGFGLKQAGFQPVKPE